MGASADAPVDIGIFEAGIHPDDLARVRKAIAACVDPDGDGRYNIEYRVLGRDDGVTRHIATSGRTTFAQGRAIGFIGAAIDVTAQRTAEAAIRASEAQFRGFAAHSSNLIWIGDPVSGHDHLPKRRLRADLGRTEVAAIAGRVDERRSSR